MNERFEDPKHSCPFCGHTEFVLGHLRSHETTWIWFEADDRGFMDSLSGVKKGDVRTRLCSECRHLDLFVPEYLER